MTTVSIVFSNENDDPIYLQVDPWAGVYLLKKREKIEIVAVSDTTCPRFDIDESGNTRILLIPDSSEYYVVLNGQRIHWEEYSLDPRLCLHCLKPLNSEDACEVLGNVCTCDKGAQVSKNETSRD